MPERAALLEACDGHLAEVIRILQPEWLIGIGRFAHARAQALSLPDPPRLETILHPSPANPAANRDWEAAVTEHLVRSGVWV
jgi:single-strand selective monofunctional uracil DNA glycosylase